MLNVAAMINSNTIGLYANEKNHEMVASLLDIFIGPQNDWSALCKGGDA